MNKVFLDANILLEIMMARSKIEQINLLLHDKASEFFISSLTVHILYYFAEVERIDNQFVQRLAGLASHLPLTARAVRLAQERYDGKDFEDCLQAACAELGGCTSIVTIDKRFARHSDTKLPVQVL